MVKNHTDTQAKIALILHHFLTLTTVLLRI